MTADSWKNHYRPPQQSLWTGRSDGPDAPRMHECITCLDLRQQQDDTVFQSRIALVGFACDVGVRRNQGRPGTAEGPRALREALAKLPVHSQSHDFVIDVGDITCDDDDLEGAQGALAEVITRLLQAGCFSIVLGGGHEVAWGHYQGIATAYPQDRIGVINFDAHFDLRPLLQGDKGTSGTSFLQIAKHCLAQGQPFDYLCLGIQRLSNTAALFETANRLGVVVVQAESMHHDAHGRVLAQIDQLLSTSDRVYVSVCMDVFAAAFAPGVSAPQPLGLLPKDVVPLFQHLANSGKVVGFDIAEVSPILDHDRLTSSLGAMLVAQWIC